ncbi:MAG: aldehyde dehydrogenase (NADP(+)) [Candidatus Acidiferrum sp.]|jgi:alpha-ketoglutaric semialdehyde dehydrogenase
MGISLLGQSLIGFNRGPENGDSFRAVNPATRYELDPPFFSASQKDLDSAVALAEGAFASFGSLAGAARAAFLRAIAVEMEATATEIIARAQEETALPIARLQGELGRTCSQLRLFASVVEEGSWVSARIDRSDPARKPSPKPGIRSLLKPLGPVAIFGASNFPLAFSVAGGDTASALAAGNPVIVKANPGHPGTSELAGNAVARAVRTCKLPEGTFSLLFDSGFSVGADLVKHPGIRAVGFTGSLKGGRVLFDLACARPTPIPFYGELGSCNPVFILPGAIRARGPQIARQLFESFTLGGGQFCTKPGIVFVPPEDSIAEFSAALAAVVAQSQNFVLLTLRIGAEFNNAIRAREHTAHVRVASRSTTSPNASGVFGQPILFDTSAESFLANHDLEKEIFGPTTLLVYCGQRKEFLDAANALEGHLTVTVHAEEEDLKEFAALLSILEKKAGRLIFNGFPTGVEVCHAMVHGGPYPASTDSRATSVGSLAILRFARPVAYQDFPNPTLPPELQDANPLGIWRLVDGKLTKDSA